MRYEDWKISELAALVQALRGLNSHACSLVLSNILVPEWSDANKAPMRGGDGCVLRSLNGGQLLALLKKLGPEDAYQWYCGTRSLGLKLHTTDRFTPDGKRVSDMAGQRIRGVCSSPNDIQSKPDDLAVTLPLLTSGLCNRASRWDGNNKCPMDLLWYEPDRYAGLLALQQGLDGVSADWVMQQADNLKAELLGSPYAGCLNGMCLPIVLPHVCGTTASYRPNYVTDELLAVTHEVTGRSNPGKYPTRPQLNGNAPFMPARYDRVFDGMKQGPLVALFFPLALRGFTPQAVFKQLGDLPDGFVLSGLTDLLLAMALHPQAMGKLHTADVGMNYVGQFMPYISDYNGMPWSYRNPLYYLSDAGICWADDWSSIAPRMQSTGLLYVGGLTHNCVLEER